ncbi:hypothetical protein Mapa_001318 [Marchantia paleacea]|nr:hypothetical protein Mapa_001318 [Marchantia paleacea]
MSGLWEISLTFNQLTNVELPTASGIFPLLLKINMEHNNMTSVPKFLGSCPVLYFLHLSDNLIESFEGFPNASPLMNLYLSNNRLVRFDLSAPSVSFSFPNICTIDLYGNNLHSVSLGNISSLDTLILDDNLLQTIPLESILKQRNLHQLRIASNQLEGSIPSEISTLTELHFLALFENKLTGAIPTSFSNLTSLMYLTLEDNNLTGPIPNFMSNISKIVEQVMFHFSHNSFSGSVPEIACAPPTCDNGHQKDYCIKLRILDISYNQLTGDLSPVTRCYSLGSSDVLLLSHNNLEGPIPTSFIWDAQPDSNRSRFSTLDLSHNRLNGSIDSRMLATDSNNNGQCFVDPGFASYLDLSNNQLTGSVPEILTNCSNIQWLKLGNNLLQGKIPVSLGRIGQSLLTLSLRDNNLDGPMPSSLGNCSSLRVLDLSGNRLSGPLPSELLGLKGSLRVLSVAKNNMSGPFPTWITSFGSLQVLDLSYNNFDGVIPESVELSNLKAFVDGGMQNEGHGTLFDERISFEAKGNTLELVYVLAITTYFGIAHNHFHGPVPPQLGLLRGLVYLTLAGNKFNGTIPESFSQLLEINSLDLSDNTLSGGIPASFALLKFISYCNLSYNRLSGIIPGGQMSTLDISNYIENPGLCDLPLPACSASTSPGIEPLISQGSSRSALDEWVSIPAVGIGFFVGFIAMTFSYLEMRRLEIASIFLVFNRHSEEDRFFAANQPYGAYVPPI